MTTHYDPTTIHTDLDQEWADLAHGLPSPETDHTIHTDLDEAWADTARTLAVEEAAR